MNTLAYDLLLIFISALISWFITHRYYKKSLADQDVEHQRERRELVEALKAIKASDATLLKQQYIDAAVEAWKKKGTPKDYIDSLSEILAEEKAEIYRAASLRHKGREPKKNPYVKTKVNT
ncbi:MAG: hypothetical protein OEV42_18045 [Deltaproteobacteria bacterium]|nr:hypothetical protein [Deltaproteobacteria bacterium]